MHESLKISRVTRYYIQENYQLNTVTKSQGYKSYYKNRYAHV